jgi:hypothetical protein
MWGRLGWVAFWLSAVLVVVQAVSLTNRAATGESDFGVFYRTAHLLAEGAGGELYEERDSATGWPISIPPAGMAVFQLFSYLRPAVAGAAWGAFNLLLCALALLALRRIFERSEASQAELSIAFPWLGAVFLVLASGSVQVGQFSVLFVACWVFALYFLAIGKVGRAMLMWAAPAAIKLYPLLMFAIPFSTSEDRRAALRMVGWFVLSLLALWYVVPSLFYGTRVWELNASFFENVVLDPSGRVKWMQALGSNANQSLDAALIRYLSYYPKFHDRYGWIPTANWDLEAVRMLGHAVRLLFIGVTVWATVRWRRGRASSGTYDLLTMAALGSSTLWICMPETRARYAVYAFLGFVPLALWAMQAENRAGRIIGFVVVLALVLGFLPPLLEVVGVGLLGSLALWMFNLWYVSRQRL